VRDERSFGCSNREGKDACKLKLVRSGGQLPSLAWLPADPKLGAAPHFQLGFYCGIESFDAAFGISPVKPPGFDPQQRLPSLS